MVCALRSSGHREKAPLVRRFLLSGLDGPSGYLGFMNAQDALGAILDAAQPDDEPTTPEEDAGVEEARTEYERGEVFDADQINRELG